jgi:hypothetical protein
MRHDVLAAQLRRLLTRGRRQPVARLPDLVELMAGQAAYVTQRTVIEYCRARSGLHWEKLFAEPAFAGRLEVCRWEGYALLLAEIAELVQIRLRRAGTGGPEAHLAALVRAAQAALARHPPPAHRASWDDAAEAVARHLARALIAAPRPVHLMGMQSADVLFELVPIHPDLRRHDRAMFRNSLRFAICGAHEEIGRRLDLPALEQALLAAGEAPAA